jgi:putative transposase
MLRTKAEEAAVEFVEVPIDIIKASSTCSRCRHHVPKMLSQREHRCSRCGLELGRDENSARVILSWALAAPQVGNRPAVEETTLSPLKQETPAGVVHDPMKFSTLHDHVLEERG